MTTSINQDSDYVVVNISNSKNDSVAFELKFAKDLTIAQFKVTQQFPNKFQASGNLNLIQSSRFKYLGSVVNSKASCDDDIKHRTSVGWMKWRENSSVFCDKKMPRKLKGKLYATVIRPALLYASECWTMYKTYESKLTAAEMKMLRMTTGVTKLDHIKSKYIRGSLFVQKPITEVHNESQMRWYCHVQRRPPENPAKKAISTIVPANGRGAGRPKNTWIRQMEKCQQTMGLSDDMILDRNACRRVLRSHTHTSGGV